MPGLVKADSSSSATSTPVMGYAELPIGWWLTTLVQLVKGYGMRGSLHPSPIRLLGVLIIS